MYFLRELEDKGFIRSSMSAYEALVMFVTKEDGLCGFLYFERVENQKQVSIATTR